MNVTELLRLLQAEREETVARADCLCEQIGQLTGALAETEARLAEIVTTGKVIDGLALPGHEPAPAETVTENRRARQAFHAAQKNLPLPADHRRRVVRRAA